MTKAAVTRRVTLALAAAGIAVSAVVASAGVVLARIYAPSPPNVDPSSLPPRLRTIDRWLDLHDAATSGLGVLALATLCGTIWTIWAVRHAGAARRQVFAVAAAAVAVAGAVAAAVTEAAVAWQQLSLASVTVGSDLDGYWPAAFHDEVRFVLVGGTEVAPGEYARTLLLYLTAPVVAGVALVLVVVALVGLPSAELEGL